MRKETIKYIDFDGNEREETFYFNLTRAECFKMNAETPGGLATVLERIVKANDSPTIYATFVDLLSRAYGVKSDDGKRLVKSEALFKAFTETNAYDELICKFFAAPGFAADFFNEVIPSEQIKEFSNTVKINFEPKAVK